MSALGVAVVGLGWWGRIVCALLAQSTKLRVVRKVDPFVKDAGVDAHLDEALRDPPIQAAFDLLRRGEIGTPLQIEANFSQDKFLSMPADNWRLAPKEAPAGR